MNSITNKIWLIPFTALFLILNACNDKIDNISDVGESISIDNEGFSLTFRITEKALIANLEDKSSGLRLADGPFVYRLDSAGHENITSIYQLTDPEITRKADQLVITGKLGELAIKHVFRMPDGGAIMEENIILINSSGKLIHVPDFEAGFTRSVADQNGIISEELTDDRWVAVPFRERPDDTSGFVNDFCFSDLLSTRGSEPHPNARQWINPAPSRHRWSEAWAWTHKEHTLGIYSFCQDNMVFSVISVIDYKGESLLRFGGACMIMNEPAALSRIEPHQSVDLGITRYQTGKSGYVGTMYSYRRMLDEAGCRFPEDYDPPVHWNQLFDMEGAWDHRAEQYTKAIINNEARRAVKFSCDALYLDPGWDTEFASFLWGEKWLGPAKEFISDMKKIHGLDIALHTPLGTWMSVGYPMGPSAVYTYPESSYRKDPEDIDKAIKVPAVRHKHRNLALLPDAKASASSVAENYALPQYAISQLNDGWYGDSQSWIAGKVPAWIEVDLGDVYSVSRVAIGNDHTMSYATRHGITRLSVMAATVYSPLSKANTWEKVAEYSGDTINGELIIDFERVVARWLRVEIMEVSERMPRIDEIEIYEDKELSSEEEISYSEIAAYKKRKFPVSPPLICSGSVQYMDEAEKRLSELCDLGVVFLMFDGNWWNGGCSDENHGHPVPYLFEDHMRANVELARRIHAKYPKVLIEMHDMIIGGSFGRVTPVYYKFGLPGSYDENWGFELMWDPLASLMLDQAVLKDPSYKPGKAIPLYYYNLGCNVPIYLHIDLSSDNIHCLSLWWYASTCRHLGIGGTHIDQKVVEAQVKAMELYKEWNRFYKRGEFYGINEEIHLHVITEEKAFVVNVFNLSDETRTIKGSINLSDLGLQPGWFYGPADWCRCDSTTLTVEIELPPWGTAQAILQSSQSNSIK